MFRIIDHKRINEINEGKKAWRIFAAQIAQGKRGRVYRMLTRTPIEIPTTFMWGPKL